MKKIFFSLFLFCSLAASAQSEYSTDTIIVNNAPAALIKKIGTGFIVYSLDGKQRLISIYENYYRFPNQRVAYPDVTVRSAEKTIETIVSNGLIDRSGLNENNIQSFINRYPSPLPVQQLNRESREEINPEIR